LFQTPYGIFVTLLFSLGYSIAGNRFNALLLSALIDFGEKLVDVGKSVVVQDVL